MSFFSRLMGGTFESNLKDAESLLELENWGEAKLSFERCLKKAENEHSSKILDIKENVKKCRFQLAMKRIDVAEDYAKHGETDIAVETLLDAGEICEEPEILKIIAQSRERYEAEEARRLLDDNEEMSEEELLAIIAGTWSEPQADEYAQLPDNFRTALIENHDENFEQAALLINGVLNTEQLNIKPKYAYLEYALVLISAKKPTDAIEQLNTFLNLVKDDDEAIDKRVTALLVMSRLLNEQDQAGEAEKCLISATKINPNNHVPLLNLGVFLRLKGELERSVQCLENAKSVMGSMHPDFTVIRELGFAYLAMDKKNDAIDYLSAVIERHFAEGTHDQYDPQAAVPLAALYEEKGLIDKASDIYRHLTEGYDSVNHFIYNLEAARLLNLQNKDPKLVQRYLLRAKELANTDNMIAQYKEIKQNLEK